MNTKTLQMLLALLLPATIFLSSCKDKTKDPEPTPAAGNMKIRVDYVFGADQQPWQLNKTFVQAKTGDSLSFTTFRYYVSNIKLKKSDGTWWSQPESYFLLDASIDNGSTISVSDVPAGTYTQMEYTMGVDSLRNVSGAQNGALSLSNGMFWDWNTGYIMLKAEGYSPDAANNGFAFHLGGFSGANNIVTVKTADFASPVLTIQNGKTPVIKLLANPARLWHSSPSVSVKATIHAPSPEAKIMALDFYNNISFVGLE